MIFYLRLSDHIVEALISLHWRRVPERMHTVQDCRDDVQSSTRQRAVKPGNTRICRRTWSASSLLWGSRNRDGEPISGQTSQTKDFVFYFIFPVLNTLVHSRVRFSPFLFLYFERSFVDGGHLCIFCSLNTPDNFSIRRSS